MALNRLIQTFEWLTHLLCNYEGKAAPEVTMDIAIIISELRKYGGSERYTLECIKRWQNSHRITLYTTALDHELLIKYEINQIIIGKLSRPFIGDNSILLNSLLLPKIWGDEISSHDIYCS